MNYEKQLKDRVWSYSSVHQYEDCPRSFFLQRIEHVPQVQNAFAEYGTFMHHLFELYFKGVVKADELAELYITDYDSHVKTKFPENKWVDLAESYYNDGLRFLEGFKGLSSKYRVLGVELEDKIDIGGFKTIGYVDLLLEDIETGELTVVDHKSKKKFASKKEELSYRRQLLFYGIYVKHLFGKYPAFVDFNMFRSQQHVIAPFSETECDAVRDWFVSTIERSLQDETFEDKIAIECREKFKSLKSFRKDDFFCNSICGVRESCPRSSAYKKKRKKTAK